MVNKRKKYLITSESRERLVVRKTVNRVISGFCPDCQKEVEMFTLDNATTLTGKRTREIFGMIESKVLHSIEKESGHLLVCRNSLEKTEE